MQMTLEAKLCAQVLDELRDDSPGGLTGTLRTALISSPMSRPLIIAIDGPSASGKSTLGRLLARELGLLYIDTGSMYRAVALAVLESNINTDDDVAVGSLASRIDIDLAGDPDSLRVTLEGEDVTNRIREEDVTSTSSIISTIPAVRRAMVKRQRELGRRGAVLNGRDIGTVVFPDADVKFFLTADVNERAGRRLAEVREDQASPSYEQTLADITERDRRDTTRADSPLVVADDAVVIDSTGLSVEQVFQQMMDVVKKKADRLSSSAT
jgi:CMP/dCMP kinase